jgi:hypothetical protein
VAAAIDSDRRGGWTTRHRTGKVGVLTAVGRCQRRHDGALGSSRWRGGTMTSTDETKAIAEALALIDRGLGEIQHRSLVPSDEVANLLLDLRLLLMAIEDKETQLN